MTAALRRLLAVLLHWRPAPTTPTTPTTPPTWEPASITPSGTYSTANVTISGRLWRRYRFTAGSPASPSGFDVTDLGDSAGEARLEVAGSGGDGGPTITPSTLECGGGGGGGGIYQSAATLSVQEYVVLVADDSVNQATSEVQPQTSGSDLIVARGADGGVGYGQTSATGSENDGGNGGTGSPTSANGGGGGGGSNAAGNPVGDGGSGINVGGDGVSAGSASGNRAGGGGGSAAGAGADGAAGVGGAGGAGTAMLFGGETWGAGGAGASLSGGAGAAGTVPGQGGGGTNGSGPGGAGYRGQVDLYIPLEAP